MNDSSDVGSFSGLGRGGAGSRNQDPRRSRRRRRLAPQLRAIVYGLIAVTAFSGLGIAIRFASEELPAAQIVFFRNCLSVLVMLPVIALRGRAVVRISHVRLHLVRAALGYCAMLSGFTAITLIPLADATALGFTMPLFATIGAVLFLGERIRAHRVAALALGFAGVLVVLRPGIEAISIGALLAIAGAILIAVSSLMVKRMTRWDSPFAITFWLVMFQTPFAFVPAWFVWQWPSLEASLWALAVGVLGTIGHLFWTNALALAEVTQLQPLDFVKLPLTALGAFVLLGEPTSAWVWIGGGVIISSTVYIANREARRGRAPRFVEKSGIAQ